MGNELFFLGLFTSSWMLFWAFAAAIPIVLHFLLQRHRREIPWAAVQFVIAAYQKSYRKFRLWQWLLLALRVLALLLLAFALADPIINNASQSATIEQPRLQIIVLDSSMSMKTHSGNGSCWSDAIERASKLCDNASSGDGFLLAQVGSTIDWVIEDISRDAVAVKQTLQALQPRDTKGSMRAAIDDITQRISSIRSDAAWNGEIQVPIFTDLQTSTWNAGTKDASLPENTNLSIVDVSRQDVSNAFVRALDIDSGFVVANEPLTIRSQIVQSHIAAPVAMLVQLLVDDVVRESQRIEISTAGQGRATWQVTLSQGEHVLGVKIPDDALNADNVRRVVANVPPVIRVACLGSDESTTRFVATALRSDTEGVIDVTEIIASRLDSLDNNSYDLAVLCDVGMLTARDASVLPRYLKQGGSLMMWLGPRCDPDTFNRLFGAGQGSNDLVLGTIESRATMDRYSVDPLGYRHRIASPFQSHPDSGFITTPVFCYWKLKRVADAKVDIAIGIGDGDPLVLTKQLSSGGSLILFTTSAYPTDSQGDQAWNAMALWPSFIPLIQESVAFVRSPAIRSYETSEFRSSIGAEQGRAEQGSSIDKFVPEDSTMPSLPSDPQQWPDQVGVYRMQRDEKFIGQIAINAPLAESDPSKMDVTQLPSTFQSDPPKTASTLSAVASNQRDGVRMFQILLVCVLACLVAESIVSHRMRAFA